MKYSTLSKQLLFAATLALAVQPLAIVASEPAATAAASEPSLFSLVVGVVLCPFKALANQFMTEAKGLQDMPIAAAALTYLACKGIGSVWSSLSSGIVALRGRPVHRAGRRPAVVVVENSRNAGLSDNMIVE